MKKTYKTTEFWGAIITNVLGIVMLLGYVNVEEGEELGNALKAIAGAVIALGSTLGYMHERRQLKTAHLNAIMQAAAMGVPTDKYKAEIKSAGL